MKTRFNPFLAAAVVSLLTLQVHGVEIIKANNADSLNLPTSWIGAAAPAAADIAVWDGTVTGANSVALGADLAWQGINPFSPGLRTALKPPMRANPEKQFLSNNMVLEHEEICVLSRRMRRFATDPSWIPR